MKKIFISIGVTMAIIMMPFLLSVISVNYVDCKNSHTYIFIELYRQSVELDPDHHTHIAINLRDPNSIKFDRNTRSIKISGPIVFAGEIVLKVGDEQLYSWPDLFIYFSSVKFNPKTLMWIFYFRDDYFSKIIINRPGTARCERIRNEYIINPKKGD